MTLAEGGMVRKSKNRRRIPEGCYTFLVFLKFFIKFNKTAVVRDYRLKTSEICGDMVGNTAMGSPCFPLAGELMGNTPIGSPLLFGHFPKCVCYPVSIVEKISNTLVAFSKELPIPFRYC